jgi:hypothetical protein
LSRTPSQTRLKNEEDCHPATEHKTSSTVSAGRSLFGGADETLIDGKRGVDDVRRSGGPIMASMPGAEFIWMAVLGPDSGRAASGRMSKRRRARSLPPSPRC